MKKLFGIILSALIAFSACANAFAYNDMETSYETEMLESLGIMAPDENGNFQPNKTITRAEAARMVTLLALGTSSVLSELKAHNLTSSSLHFSDVSADCAERDHILWASSMGVMSGFDDGTFRPNEDVTYAQLIKMLDTILGYTTYAELNGGYPDGYILYAKKLGLLSGLGAFKNDDSVTRGAAAKLMGAALDVPVVVVTQSMSAKSQGEKKPELKLLNGTGKNYQTLLTMKFNTYIANGTVKDAQNGTFVINSSKNFDNEYFENSAKEISLNAGGYSLKNGENLTVVIIKTANGYAILNIL